MAGTMAGPSRCTLIIDGSCALCRASGTVAKQLDPTTAVVDGGATMVEAAGVVLVHDGVRLEGLDAVLGWLALQGRLGAGLARLGHLGPLHRALQGAYRGVARHRHALDGLASGSSRRRSRGR